MLFWWGTWRLIAVCGDCSLGLLFFFFLLLPVWLFRHKGCTNYRKRDTRKEFIWIITNKIKPCCTGRIHVIDRWIGEIWWRAVNSRWGSKLYGALPPPQFFSFFAWLLICCSMLQLKSLYRYFGVGVSLFKWTLRFGVLSVFNGVNTLGKFTLPVVLDSTWRVKMRLFVGVPCTAESKSPSILSAT